ncbi:uncharacterized protein prr14 [Electrophorus electricus]|uniref:Proline rich 14 n=1 Tax=Electrophorus electricus TaxID=8005 RepID=A0AAY5EAJ7_ELEEL|nr:uncharacterized protein prr14 [Electrophorus electricus]
MLTSTQECVLPMEDDGQSVGYHGEPAPQTSSNSSVFHSCEDARRSSGCQRKSGLTGERAAKRQRENPSPIKQSYNRNNNEDKADIQEQQQEGKLERLDVETKLPEDPPPTKKWVIGPLFQSFKFKMASFTEIVMSPIRIFKSDNSPPPKAPSGHHEQLTGSNLKQSSTDKQEQMDIGCVHKDEVFSQMQAKNTAQNQCSVVQRLVFDSDSSNVNNSEDNAEISPKGSKRQRDASSSSGVESQPAPRNDAGAVGSDAFGIKNPCPDSSYCSHSLTPDAEQRGQVDSEDTFLGMPTRKSPGKESKDPLEQVAFQGSDAFSQAKAADFSNTLCARKRVDDLRKPMECVHEDKGTIVETSGSCESLEREKIGQVSRSRTRRKRDMKCRAAAALGVVNDTSDVSSSSVDEKGTMATSDLQSSTTNVTGRHDGGECVLTGSFSPVPTPPRGTMSDCAPGIWAAARKEGQCHGRAMPCADRRHEDSETGSRGVHPVVFLVPLAFPAGAPMAGAESPGREAGHAASGLERTQPVRQSKHKLETSSTTTGATTLGPAAKKPSIHSQRAGTRVVKKGPRVFEEQGVSMSLTLQVAPAAHGHEDPAVPFAHACSAPRLKRCRTTRKRRAEAGAAADNGPDPSPAPKLFGDGPSVPKCARDSGTPKGEVDGLHCKNDVSKKAEAMVDREARRRGAPEDGVPAAPPSCRGSSRLLRSLSCPDIPSLQDSGHAPLAPSHDKFLFSPYRRSSTAPPHSPTHSLYKRTRRHTVCTVEIEREIAPLCLRKEVHPVGWARASGHPYPCSPPSVLASCFLSSPLAFRSSRPSRGWSDACKTGAGSSTPVTLVTPLSASPLESLPASELMVFPGPSACGPSLPEWASASVSHPCSVLEPVPGEMDHDGDQHRRDVHDGLALGPELPSHAVSDEKHLSHLEIKFQTDVKRVQRSKVSSIRIRKTLPKPQYNLTPMGLPKAVRIKKKIFSVEEIYTNKNFSQPPEGRLETIYEVPLSRRDGSQSLIGQKRVKRFVEFPELGVARKPRKPPIGAAGVGGGQRKGAGNPGTGRTRRGVWASTRDEDALNLQEVESLLCSKLNELDSWMALEQMAY